MRSIRPTLPRVRRTRPQTRARLDVNHAPSRRASISRPPGTLAGERERTDSFERRADMADIQKEELNLNGFDGPFTGQIGNFEDYSRDFLIKLVKVYDDCSLFAYHAWATALAKHVGEAQAWEVAGEVQRGVGRQILPFTSHAQSNGPAWPGGLTVTHFELTADKLSKEAL